MNCSSTEEKRKEGYLCRGIDCKPCRAAREKKVKVKNVDLRMNEVKDAIIDIGKAVKESKLTTRALALLITDSNKALKLSHVEAVLKAIPGLEKKYLK